MLNLPYSRFETCLEVILQLTYLSYPIELKQKNVLKKKAELFEDKEKLFSLLGDKQKFKFGGI